MDNYIDTTKNKNVNTYIETENIFFFFQFIGFKVVKYHKEML